MDAPDISKHLKEIVGGLVLELATAKAVNEWQEKALAEARASGSGTTDGAQGAHEPSSE